MTRLACLLSLSFALLAVVAEESPAGLLCKSKARTAACCTPAAPCCTAEVVAPVACCDVAAPCATTVAGHKHHCRLKHARKALKHGRCTSHCLPVAAPCTTVGSYYGTMPYSYGIPTDGPHWF